MTLAIVIGVVAVVLLAATAAVYLATVTGSLVLDLGWGRRLRPLGPLHVDIAAPPATVYALLVQPYLGRTTRALADKVQVIERGSDMVLAAHRTPISGRLTAVTVESVKFTAGERIDFRLLRGPVPHVVEKFALTPAAAGCRLDYDGQLGTDFAAIGAWWGAIVARRWQATVNASMHAVKTEAERQNHPRG